MVRNIGIHSSPGVYSECRDIRFKNKRKNIYSKGITGDKSRLNNSGDYLPDDVDYANEYLTIEALQDGCRVYFNYNIDDSYTPPSEDDLLTIEYSKNKRGWIETKQTPIVIDENNHTCSLTPFIELQAGEKLYLRGNNSSYFNVTGGIAYSSNIICAPSDLNNTFEYHSYISSNIYPLYNVSGNIMSLIYGDDFQDKYELTGDGCFINLFTASRGFTIENYLSSAENLILPATTLAEGCYAGMFSSCNSLTNAPELPATTLADYCYSYMFIGCTNITSAPELPATTLAEGCYAVMFYACTSLTNAPELPATTLAEACYYEMFSDCTSLVNAPELPAETLVSNCYNQMFYRCSNLNNVKCLATDISSNECTKDWLYGVASAGTFYQAVGMSDWQFDSPDGVPVGWTLMDAQ